MDPGVPVGNTPCTVAPGADMDLGESICVNIEACGLEFLNDLEPLLINRIIEPKLCETAQVRGHIDVA